jgi:hypothetical protein
MKFEVVQQGGAWIVRRDGVELSRYAEQAFALSDVTERLRELEPADEAVSLAMRYEAREPG